MRVPLGPLGPLGYSRPVSLLFLHHNVDLATVGQAKPEDPTNSGARLVEAAFLAGGRPVLVVPYAWELAGLPARAARVVLVTVNPAASGKSVRAPVTTSWPTLVATESQPSSTGIH